MTNGSGKVLIEKETLLFTESAYTQRSCRLTFLYNFNFIAKTYTKLLHAVLALADRFSPTMWLLREFVFCVLQLPNSFHQPLVNQSPSYSLYSERQFITFILTTVSIHHSLPVSLLA